MLSEKEKLDRLAVLGTALSEVKDLDLLMERILTEARRFVNADAGSIYVRDGDRLHFTYTQNETLQKRLHRGEKLIYSTFSIPISDKSLSGYVAKTGQPLNVPDVYMLEPTCPYHFDRTFDETSGYTTRTMLTVPMKNSKGRVLGVLQIINGQDDANRVVPFSLKDEDMMMHFASIAAVALARAQMTRAILLRMIKMAEMRDPKETGAHVNRVGAFAVEIYEKWAGNRNVTKKEIDESRDILRMAAMLHDVGKIAISDVILKKRDRLNTDEYETMKKHTVLGAQLFVDHQSDFDEAAAQVALNHHERWDGKGYPGHVDIATGKPLQGCKGTAGLARGKREEEIPLYGRIVALADVYDALSSKRVYKEAWGEPEVLAEIEQSSGRHFDPELVEIFFSRLEAIRSIQKRYVDTD